MIQWGTFWILLALALLATVGGFYQPVLGIFTIVFTLGAVWAYAEAKEAE